jgi:hypothetical protein
MAQYYLYSYDRRPADISAVYTYKTLSQNFQTKFSQNTRKLTFMFPWYRAEIVSKTYVPANTDILYDSSNMPTY